MNAGQHFDSSQFKPRTTRRQFLEQTAGLAAGAGLLGQIGAADGEPGSAAAQRLPTIKIGPYEVTRLIIGGNPIYGYSHFNHLFSEHQRAAVLKPPSATSNPVTGSLSGCTSNSRIK